MILRLIETALLLVFLLLGTFSYCQSFVYQEYGLNDGLPSNQVYDIYEAKNGTIWFATDRGIASYDGSEFTAYGINDGLLNNSILDFHPQKDGKIFCSTIDNQLFYFTDKFDGFHKYKYSDTLKKVLRDFNKIIEVYKDSLGNHHFAFEHYFNELIIKANGEIDQIESTKPSKTGPCYRFHYKYVANGNIYGFKSTETISKSGYKRIELCDIQSTDLEMIRSTKFDIFRNIHYVSIISNSGKEIQRIDNGLRPLCVNSISNNQLFIGYLFGGGQILNHKGIVIDSFLPEKSVTRFLVDKEGGYWFTTLHSGIFYLKNHQISSINQSITTPISSLSRNENKELTIGYENGSIAYLKNNKKEVSMMEFSINLRAFTEYNQFTEKAITFTPSSLELGYPIENSTNNLSCTPEELYLTKFSEPIDQRIISSNMSSIWIYRLKDYKYNIEEINLPFRSHDACFYKNDIYLCTMSGLYIIQNEKIQFLGNVSEYFNYRADDIDINMKKNELYIATLGAGLIVYDKDSVYAIQEKDGLFNNIVNEVYIENESNIWACTNSGLNKIHFNPNGSYQITGLRSTDGLPNDGITDIEIINDTVWIGSKKGLVYAPKSLFESEIDKSLYQIELTKTLVNDFIFSVAQLKDLSYKESRIEFNIQTVSQKLGNTIRYKYKLQDLESDFRLSKSKKITYPAIPPGEYNFLVQAVTKNGVELTDFLKVPITIHPPFWETYWFRIGLVLFLGGIVYLFFRLQILSYNQNITGEVLRMILKRLKRKEKYFVFKDGAREKRIKSDTITYVKSDGNYLRIFTMDKNYLIRCKIGEFIALTPDPKEYLRIHRSYIIRIDKVESKGKQEVTVLGQKIPVSVTYEDGLEKLIF